MIGPRWSNLTVSPKVTDGVESSDVAAGKANTGSPEVVISAAASRFEDATSRRDKSTTVRNTPETTVFHVNAMKNYAVKCIVLQDTTFFAYITLYSYEHMLFLPRCILQSTTWSVEILVSFIPHNRDSLHEREKSEKMDYLKFMKYFSLVLLVGQNTVLVLLMRYTRTQAGDMYAASTAVFVMEVSIIQHR